MGGFALTTGTVRVKSCPETMKIVEELRVLADGMDERNVLPGKAGEGKYGSGILEVEVNIYGYASASHASEINDKVREFGPYAVEAAKFTTEWESQQGRFFVGSKEQVARAESKDALERIQELVHKLREDDAARALQAVTRRAKMPPFKRRYFESSCNICPFCRSKNVASGPLEADGVVAWAPVECPDCGHSWQDVWVLIDVTDVLDKDGREVPCGSSGMPATHIEGKEEAQ